MLLAQDKLGREVPPDENHYTFPPVVEFHIDPVPLSELVDWSHRAIGIDPAWTKSRGDGVTVAVLDTGCDTGHPDLQGAIKEAQDFTGSPNGFRDLSSHGTWCAGFIGARADNDMGIRGIAPKSGILVGKVLDDRGYGTDQSILAGIRWAVSENVDIISMSLGGRGMSGNVRRAIAEANSKNITVICAAGNDGRGNSVNDPARWPETVAISATDENGNLARFSSYGPEIDVAAPGSNMTSTLPGGMYGRMSGTSMATPLVAGVVALYVGHRISEGLSRPTLAEVREALAKSSIDKGAPGKDPMFGVGLINPGGLLDTVAGRIPDEPPSDVPGWNPILRQILVLLLKMLERLEK